MFRKINSKKIESFLSLKSLTKPSPTPNKDKSMNDMAKTMSNTTSDKSPVSTLLLDSTVLLYL